MSNLPVSVHDSLTIPRNNIEKHYIAQLHNQVEYENKNYFRDYISIFIRRKWIIINSLFITIIIVTWGISQKEPLYESKTTLMIDKEIPQIVPMQGVLLQNLSPLTEIEILKDRSIIKKVVESLQLGNNLPKEEEHQEYDNKNVFIKKVIISISAFIEQIKNIIKSTIMNMIISKKEKNVISTFDPHELYIHEEIQKFQKSLKVNLREETKLVDITLMGNDPHTVSQQLDTLVDVYIKNDLDRKLHETRKSIIWLQKEEKELEKKLLTSESFLQKFREIRNFIDFYNGEEQNPIFQNLYDLNSSYISAKKDRFYFEKQINELKNSSSYDSVNKLDNLSMISNNSLVKELGYKYIELKSQYESLSKTYKEKHPKILMLSSQMTEIRNAIIENLKKEYEILTEKESNLENEIGFQRNNIIKYKEDMGDYESLKREFEINRNLYTDILKKLRESALTEALETNNIKVISPASVPIYPVPSGKVYKILAGIIIGLGIGVGFCFATEYFDRRFKNADEVESYLRIPFLGTLPRHRAATKKIRAPFLLQEPESFESEAYRILRTRIHLSPLGPIKTLLVTSAHPAEGKSTTVANLGISFAQLGQTVLLVDVDLRCQSLHRHFHLPNHIGLVDVLVHRTGWRQAIQDTNLEHLKVLSTGVVRHIPSELLNIKDMEKLIVSLREAFNIVIFDASPVLSISDVEVLAPKMDGVLLVHNPDKEDKEALLEAKKILERTYTSLLGIVFNNIDIEKNKYGHQRYSYNYYSPNQ